MPLNDRGTLTPYRLPPPDRLWAELKEPAAEYRKLIGDRQAAYHRLSSLEDQRTKAIDADRRALAKALREGGEDPGDTAVEKIDADMAACRRLIESLELAIDEAESDLMGVVDEHQPAWVKEVDAEVDADAQEYLAAVEHVEAMRTKLAETVALKRFLNTFPEHGYNSSHWPVWGLLARHGDPYRWDEVIDALRKDAEVARKPATERQEVGEGIVVHEHELRVPSPAGSYVDHKSWGTG
jgi:hypothetical protein